MTTLRTALREQSPSPALQRAAADEIARLDALVRGLQSVRPSEGGELPPLPPMTDLGDAGASNYGYSEDDMRAYARAALAAAPAVGARIACPLDPHPIADIICAWANGFRVEFRYRHHNPGIPELIYLSDERWHICGRAYSAWSGINEHRIHADDLAAWEAFKRASNAPVQGSRP